MRKLKRRKYFVNTKVQLRYMGLIAIPLVVLLIGLYYLMYYSVFSEMLIPEAIATVLLPAMKRVNIVALVTVPILLFFILRVALIYSNRLIGPVSRIERDLDKVIAGERSIKLKVRHKDDLKPLVNKINMALEKMGER